MKLTKEEIYRKVLNKELSEPEALELLRSLAPVERAVDRDSEAPVSAPVAASGVGLAPARGEGAGLAPIAIIGAAGVLPGSPDLDAFWDHLQAGSELIRPFPDARLGGSWSGPSPEDRMPGGYLDDIDCFDAAFFGISPREAAIMDPRQRLFLQTVWSAFEDAGLRPGSLAGSATGLFVGAGGSDYDRWPRARGIDYEAHLVTGTANAVLANRISFLLDLRGPSEPVDTACSSSLVAILRAVDAIRSGVCNLAIAGGVHLVTHPATYAMLRKTGMISKEGRCRVFDRDADGYVPGEGAGAVILKPLGRAIADGDRIWAVIRGGSVSHGGRSNFLTTPNPLAQAEVLIQAYRQAGIDPATIGYIESGSNGMPLGDPIEIAAFRRAFARLHADYDRKRPERAYCGIGSVKTNIGHLQAASGMASLFKVILAMRHRTIPSHRHFQAANPHLYLEDGPFFVHDRSRAWAPVGEARDGAPLRAGVNAFGLTGVNAHLILESHEERTRFRDSGEARIFTLSAKDDAQLKRYAARWVDFLDQAGEPPSLSEIAFTLQVGREAMGSRLAALASDCDALRDKLESYCGGRSEIPDLWTGSRTAGQDADLLGEGREAQIFLHVIIQDKKFQKLAKLWASGLDIDWAALYRPGGGLGPRPARAALPLYPFRKTRFWATDLVAETALPNRFLPSPLKGRIELESALREQVARVLMLSGNGIGPGEELAAYGFDSFSALSLIQEMQTRYGLTVPASLIYEGRTIEEMTELLVERRSPIPAKGGRALPDHGGVVRSPLSETQKAWWFLQQLAPESADRHIAGLFWVRPTPKPDLLQSVLDTLADRHAATRTVFTLDEDQPVQWIRPNARIELQTEALGALEDEALTALIRQKIATPFDLEKDALFRIHLLVRSPEESALLLVLHRIIIDDASFARLINELTALYNAELSGAPAHLAAVRSNYLSFVDWQRRMPHSEEGEKQWTYWRNQLAGALPDAAWFAHSNKKLDDKSRFAAHRLEIEPGLYDELEIFARAKGVDIFAVLFATLATLIHNYSGQYDILIGTPAPGRPGSRFANTVGAFANMVPIRVGPVANASFTTLIKAIQTSLSDAFQHGDLPYPTLIERLGLRRGRPLFRTVFRSQTWISDLDAATPWRDDADPRSEASLRLEPVPAPLEAGGFDLVFEAADFPGKHPLDIKYNTSLFERETIERMADHYRTLLEGLMRAADSPVGLASMLSEAEESFLFDTFNHEIKDYPKNIGVHQLFEERVRRSPAAPAFVADGLVWSYDSLNGRANQLARILRGHGVGPETLTAIAAPSSIDRMVSVLAILKAGGGYVVVDPDLTIDRIAAILSEARVGLAVATSAAINRIPRDEAPFDAIRWLLLDQEQEHIDSEATDNPDYEVRAENLAKAAFHFDASNQPIGVLTPHWNLVNFCNEFAALHRIEPSDRVLLFPASGPGNMTDEFFAAWIGGAVLALAPDNATVSVAAFLEFLIETRITVVALPTAFWRKWVVEMTRDELPLPQDPRLVIAGGETVAPDQLAVWRATVGQCVRWSHTYGPAETLFLALHCDLERDPVLKD